MNISRHFPDRPIYALRARGFDGEEFFRSMDEMIDCYHQAIKRRQPEGPYALAGYSFGSILAFEITKIMERDGDQVRFLATIDQPPHFKKRARGYDWYETVSIPPSIHRTLSQKLSHNVILRDWAKFCGRS